MNKMDVDDCMYYICNEYRPQMHVFAGMSVDKLEDERPWPLGYYGIKIEDFDITKYSPIWLAEECTKTQEHHKHVFTGLSIQKSINTNTYTISFTCIEEENNIAVSTTKTSGLTEYDIRGLLEHLHQNQILERCAKLV